MQGVDDILAMLLAFSALPEELEVLLIAVTYGNIDVQNCLRNVISLFQSIEMEIAWRGSHNRALGFSTLLKSKPLVAVGPERPLADQILMADYFHGADGLGGIHHTHPHLSPHETWEQIMKESQLINDGAATPVKDAIPSKNRLFTPSASPAHREMLRLLRESEPGTITIVAVGPLTNLAVAAAEDPETFLRCKEVVVMGGAVDTEGNVRFLCNP
nr:uridine nucleosidase 1 [Quercus suber]